jgi:thermostable 8-oxoguanine DNA glycosylase
MKIRYEITPADIDRVGKFLNQWSADPLVVARVDRNLANEKPPVSRADFWLKMLACLLTSQQRSGPDSPVTKFLCVDPFPLLVEACDGCDVEALVKDALQHAGGIRFTNNIAKYAAANLPLMTGDAWAECTAQLEHLRRNQTVEAERRVATFIDDRFYGFGPKQSRNLLQMLGLTRYEIPIDSRIMKWMEDFGFPLPLHSDLLGYRDYYEFVEDAVHALCSAAGVSPCVLDAAIFASFDEGTWTKELAVW